MTMSPFAEDLLGAEAAPICFLAVRTGSRRPTGSASASLPQAVYHFSHAQGSRPTEEPLITTYRRGILGTGDHQGHRLPHIQRIVCGVDRGSSRFLRAGVYTVRPSRAPAPGDPSSPHAPSNLRRLGETCTAATYSTPSPRDCPETRRHEERPPRPRRRARTLLVASMIQHYSSHERGLRPLRSDTEYPSG